MTPAFPSTAGGAVPPRLSVVVMAHARRDFVLSAVRSAREQSFPRSQYEIIVIADFTDPSIDSAVAADGGRSVRDEAPYVGSTVARALTEARGEVVCFLDDDDEMEPTKLQNVAALFAADPDLVLLRNAYRPIDVRGLPLLNWPVVDWPAASVRRPVTLRTTEEKRASRVLPMYNLSTISVRRRALAPFAPRFRGVRAGSDSLVFLSGLSTTGHVRVDPGIWNRHRVHGSVSMETFGQTGVRPPPSPEYLERSLVALRQQQAIVRGTVAEPWARWIYLITRFDAFLGRPEFSAPSLAEFRSFARGAIRERQPFRLWTLGFAAFGRVAPSWSRQRWWQFRQQRHMAQTAGADQRTMFSVPEDRR